MTETNLCSAEFKERLLKVYSENEIEFQMKRYLDLANKFKDDFGTSSCLRFFSSPGRTEICGNHTDHNNGKVLAAAIDLDAVACVKARTDTIINAHSEGYSPVTVDFSNTDVVDDEAGKSSALIRGICARFLQLGYKVGGFDAVITSRVLSGSGLSSSAAYEVLIGTILNYLYNDGKISPVVIAQISQYSENVYFKKPCGLLDQTACSVGGFVEIDFKDTSAPVIEKSVFDLKNFGHLLCIVDTGGNHADLTDDYAAIRSEMNTVANFFNKSVLREVDESDVIKNLASIREKTGDRALLRALHFYGENKRVEEMSAALKNGDFETFKRIILESGRSSYMYNQNCFTSKKSHEQPVSLALCLAEKFLDGEGAFRVHGGGFAGTVQIFLPEEKAESFVASMSAVFGENSCYILNIRSVGGCEI